MNMAKISRFAKSVGPKSHTSLKVSYTTSETFAQIFFIVNLILKLTCLIYWSYVKLVWKTQWVPGSKPAVDMARGQLLQFIPFKGTLIVLVFLFLE